MGRMEDCKFVKLVNFPEEMSWDGGITPWNKRRRRPRRRVAAKRSFNQKQRLKKSTSVSYIIDSFRTIRTGLISPLEICQIYKASGN